MFKVVTKLKDSLTNASMSASTSLLFGVLTWIRVYLNVKTVGNGVIQHFLAGSKDLSVSNAMVLTSWKITANLDGAIKWMKNQILNDLKQRKRNHAHICSNAWIAGVTTKLTQICVCSKGIDSIRSGNRRSMPRSMKTGSNQFTL